ncbi:MAG: ATP-binding cassette domain-containing protein [Verrucomicrobiota bacterium]|jgi:ABC-type glutathione transport system ATPase component
MTAPNIILKTENLSVSYRSREPKQGVNLAVRNLNLLVHQGEVFGFLGPNGAGKTTTMNVLLGLPTGPQLHGTMEGSLGHSGGGPEIPRRRPAQNVFASAGPGGSFPANSGPGALTSNL